MNLLDFFRKKPSETQYESQSEVNDLESVESSELLTFKELVDLDHPVIIDGIELKTKLNENLQQLIDSIYQIDTRIKIEYANCIEGSAKAEHKHSLQKDLHELRLKELWLARLHKVIDENKRYSLSLTEAVSFGLMADVTIK